jgi:hypothetical protein
MLQYISIYKYFTISPHKIKLYVEDYDPYNISGFAIVYVLYCYAL